MRTLALACAVLAATASVARADDNPKRKVVVLEYRSGSSALVGIAGRLATEMSKLTSLGVLGPAQAKTVFGENLDQVVVKCGGEAECVAKIGAKLGAADVVLIGVSELGDVILTMQRIDVASRTVSTRITDNSVGQPWGAAWFPDGNRIAYSHQERLIVQPLGGGEVETFNSPVRGRLVRTPAISPDGTKMMFQVDRDGAWMLDLADNSMRRILDDPAAEEFTWSPDGRRVAYYSRRSGEWGVWMMAPR